MRRADLARRSEELRKEARRQLRLVSSRTSTPTHVQPPISRPSTPPSELPAIGLQQSPHDTLQLPMVSPTRSNADLDASRLERVQRIHRLANAHLSGSASAQRSRLPSTDQMRNSPFCLRRPLSDVVPEAAASFCVDDDPEKFPDSPPKRRHFDNG